MLTKRLASSNLSNVLPGRQSVNTLSKTTLVSFDEKGKKTELVPLYFRAFAFERWGSAANTQNRITLMQIAEISILQGLKILNEMNDIILKALPNNTEHQARLLVLRDMLCQLQPSYLGIQLFNNNLNLKYFSRKLKRNFKLKKINILDSKNRDEVVTFYVYNENTLTPVCVSFPANASSKELTKVINRTITSYGLEISNNIKDLNNDEAIFNCDEELWDKFKHGIMLQGQGQRLPSGEPRQIQVEEIYSWQNPIQWKLSHEAGIRDSLIKIQKTKNKLEKQLILCRHEKNVLTKDIKPLFDNPDAALAKLIGQLKNGRFSRRINTLVAQANISVKQSIELLK